MMKRNILAENMRRFGTKNLSEQDDLNNSINRNIVIKVKSVEIDWRRTSSTVYYDEELDGQFIDMLRGDIEQQIEDSKVYGVYAGTPDEVIDIDRIVSDIKFDGEAIFENPTGGPNIEIDFSFEMGSIDDVDMNNFQTSDKMPAELEMTEEELAEIIHNRMLAV